MLKRWCTCTTCKRVAGPVLALALVRQQVERLHVLLQLGRVLGLAPQVAPSSVAGGVTP